MNLDIWILAEAVIAMAIGMEILKLRKKSDSNSVSKYEINSFPLFKSITLDISLVI